MRLNLGYTHVHRRSTCFEVLGLRMLKVSRNVHYVHYERDLETFRCKELISSISCLEKTALKGPQINLNVESVPNF